MTKAESEELLRLATAHFDARQAVEAAWKPCAPLVDEQRRALDAHTAAMRAVVSIPSNGPDALQLHTAAKAYEEDCIRALDAANARCTPVFEAWRRQCEVSREASRAYLTFFKRVTATDGGKGD